MRGHSGALLGCCLNAAEGTEKTLFPAPGTLEDQRLPPVSGSRNRAREEEEEEALQALPGVPVAAGGGCKLEDNLGKES